MSEKESSESLSAKSNKVFKFKWTNSMIEDLLNAIKEYKSVMEFNCSDFNADKPRLYEEVRRLLSNIYEPMYFGPDVNLEQDGDQVSNKDLIKIGYKRVMEKTKELRQKFSKAVTNEYSAGENLTGRPVEVNIEVKNKNKTILKIKFPEFSLSTLIFKQISLVFPGFP